MDEMKQFIEFLEKQIVEKGFINENLYGITLTNELLENNFAERILFIQLADSGAMGLSGYLTFIDSSSEKYRYSHNLSSEGFN